MVGDVSRHVLRRRAFGHFHGRAVLLVCRCAGRAVLSHESVVSLNAQTYAGLGPERPQHIPSLVREDGPLATGQLGGGTRAPGLELLQDIKRVEPRGCRSECWPSDEHDDQHRAADTSSMAD